MVCCTVQIEKNVEMFTAMVSGACTQQAKTLAAPDTASNHLDRWILGQLRVV